MDILKKDAIEAYGTQQALADALGISRTAVTMWSNDRPIPKEHQLRLRYELLPDVFGEPAQPASAAKSEAA
jgi:transcriptional regulator with XRE-family HTH domain